MNKWLSVIGILIIGALTMGTASCGKRPVRSLCILDVEAQMCWVNYEKGIGFTFEQIRQMLAGNNAMYCVDTHDMRRIQRRLSACEANR